MARRAADAPDVQEGNTNGVVFWPVAVFVFLLDVATKALAQFGLQPAGWPYPVIGDWVRFTLVYNPGAAFGMHVGPWSRWIFLALTAVVLRVLWSLYKQTRDRDNRRVFALAILCAGALGNAVDRLASSRGVVDFLDVGVRGWRWPTFNVADVGVTCGAALLAWVLWREADLPEAEGVTAAAPAAPATPDAGALRTHDADPYARPPADGRADGPHDGRTERGAAAPVASHVASPAVAPAVTAPEVP